MKNNRVGFFVLLTVAAAWAVAGCQVAEHDKGNGDGAETGVQYLDIVMAAQQEGDDTRTGVTNGGTAVSWTSGDAIAVFCDGRSSRLVNSSSSVSDFTGNLPVDVTTMSSGAYVWGLYPYNASATFASANNRITTVLPAVQTAKAGSFDDNLMLLVGRTQLQSSDLEENPVTLSMTFKNVCSGVRFKVTRSDIQTVTMQAIGGENLCGTVQIGLDGSGNPTVQNVSGGSSTIELQAPNGGTFATNTWYYFVTLPGTLSQGAEFTMTTDTKEGVRTVSSSIALARKDFRQAADLDSGISFDDLVVEVQVAAPDTWVAEDELQRRVMPANPSAPRANKEVVMMYWPWHEIGQVNYTTVVNITTVVRDPTPPSALDNYFDARWVSTSDDQRYFWGQPLFGYYRTTDPWVLRKHAEMLADAGVDAVMFDLSNGRFTWWNSVEELMSVWNQARLQGVKVPKIAFMLHLDAPGADCAAQLRAIYTVLYKPHRYEELWFKVDNKPCIMAFPACLKYSSGESTADDDDIRNFFTWRPGQFDYVSGTTQFVYTPDEGEVVPPLWGWLQVYPQHSFNNNEQMPVGVAQNACPDSDGHFYAFNVKDSQGNFTAYGRSYTADPATYHDRSDNGAFVWGYNIQQQWDRALTYDPHYILVTGWNEWISKRFSRWPTSEDDPNYGYTPVAFADTFDWERSRDIEPTLDWGDYGDSYFYQLAKNIRTFKGVSAYPNVTRAETMEIDGDFSGWDQVSPDFRHYPGNTMHRAHLGHTNGNIAYFNNTGRNDFVDAKVTRDAAYVYFYVETAANITAYSQPLWMRLLINKDMDWSTGWKGYDYCLNLETPSSDTLGYISVCSGTTWNWSRHTTYPTFDYRLVGNKMELRIPRSLFPGNKLDFAFKWADNNLEEYEGRETRILNLYVDGDAAPGGRYNFHYKEP